MMEKLRKFLGAALRYAKLAAKYLGELIGLLEKATKEEKPEDKPE
jgi:hypothetical protein